MLVVVVVDLEAGFCGFFPRYGASIFVAECEAPEAVGVGGFFHGFFVVDADALEGVVLLEGEGNYWFGRRGGGRLAFEACLHAGKFCFVVFEAVLVLSLVGVGGYKLAVCAAVFLVAGYFFLKCVHGFILPGLPARRGV